MQIAFALEAGVRTPGPSSNGKLLIDMCFVFTTKRPEATRRLANGLLPSQVTHARHTQARNPMETTFVLRGRRGVVHPRQFVFPAVAHPAFVSADRLDFIGRQSARPQIAKVYRRPVGRDNLAGDLIAGGHPPDGLGFLRAIEILRHQSGGAIASLMGAHSKAPHPGGKESRAIGAKAPGRSHEGDKPGRLHQQDRGAAASHGSAAAGTSQGLGRTSGQFSADASRRGR